jgi:hypothetical protein
VRPAPLASQPGHGQTGHHLGHDFAEHLLTSWVRYAERVTEAIKPLLGGAKEAAKKDDST